MRFKSILYSVTFILVALNASAQYYNTGQDPSGLKWLQVKTGRFKVIYPQNYGSAGVEFARALENAYSDLSALYPDKKFKIPVIIHNYSTQSNGYVAWAPKRMEIYPTPDQNTIPLDHTRQLTLHELTHVLQMESLNSGFSKAMSFVTGQQFTGAVAALLPIWFMEGEAVYAETLLSQSGRGRSPVFQNSLKAIAIEKGSLYKYDKLLNGSYRDFTPDHYQFGYQMVAWSLLNNDPLIWNKVLGLTGSQPFTLNPVNISLKKNAGLTKKQLYYQAFDTLTSLWKKDIEMSGAIEYNTINPFKKTRYESYFSAVNAGDDSVIAVKTSLVNPVSFVLIRPSEKSEKKLYVPGNIYPWFISYATGKIVWVESQPDPRWENRNYSVIKLLDLKTLIHRQLTYRSRYLSASVSPDGNMIAASENTEKNINNLVFINPDDGSILKSVPSPGNAYLQRPQWSSDGKKITVISLTEEGEGILAYSIAEQVWTTLLEEGRDDLQSSFLRNDSLFYISSASGTDNIYVRAGNGKLSSLTRSKFGATDLNVAGDKVYFSNYSASGNNICMASVPEAVEIDEPLPSPVSYLIDRIDKKQSAEQDDPVIDYTPEPYRKWKHLFGIHSWMPLYADIEQIQSDPTSIRPGVTIMSQNQLSTLTTSVGYEYSADKRHKLHSRISWDGWYPVIESRIDYGNEPIIKMSGEQVSWTPSPVKTGLRFINTVYIPWYFNTGKFYQYFYPFLSVDYMNDYVYVKETGNYDYGQTYLTGRLYIANYFRSAYRDIYPRLGQIIDASYNYAPFDKLIYGSDINLKAAFYFPGFFKNHGIRIRYETENQKFILQPDPNRIHYPRGYDNIRSRELDFISIDYVAPVAYPDFNIASFFYMTRIRIGLFYDYARGTDNYHLYVQDSNLKLDHITMGNEFFSSFGLELVSDFYFLRIPYPVSAGVQAAWKDFSNSPSFEFIFNIDIYGMNIGKLRR
ncbi:MAG: hypothetical protein NTW82_01430 [Bacteroidia bacterium]|nr:hypothetical protein [Bacteroidia bacterium]